MWYIIVVLSEFYRLGYFSLNFIVIYFPSSLGVLQYNESSNNPIRIKVSMFHILYVPNDISLLSLHLSQKLNALPGTSSFQKRINFNTSTNFTVPLCASHQIPTFNKTLRSIACNVAPDNAIDSSNRPRYTVA